MGTQMIEYQYSGDEAPWRAAIEMFLAGIAADPVLKGGLSYQVFVRSDGISRVHIPVWRDQGIVQHLQAQPFFAKFSASTKAFAGGSVTVTKPTLASDD